MESAGNEVVYQHKMYVTARQPFIILNIGRDILYINFKPIETVITGATIYGLFELVVEKRP